LQASFIPPPGQRALRDRTRDRPTLGQERRREGNRGQGVLERANIKLGSVATDLMGLSGRAILSAVVEGGTDPATLAAWAHGRMRSPMPRLEQALTGLVRDQHRRWLALPWAPIAFLDEQIDALSAELTRDLTERSADAPPARPADVAGAPGSAAAADTPAAPLTLARAVTILDTIPGVHQRGAELLVAEWGSDMGRFGTAERLSAWSGVAPGPHESAGKQRSGKTRPGHRARRPGLTPWAPAAARTKSTDLSALYQRLAARRGKTRAMMAVAQALVVSAFPRRSRNQPYQEVGANYCDAHRRQPLVDRLARRIERLGDRVSRDPVAAA
jgi:transposase